MTNLKTKILSAIAGYKLPEDKRQSYFDKRFQYLLKHKETLNEIFSEPWLLDDLFIAPNHVEMLKRAICNYETLLVENDDGRLIGMAVFTPVKHGRHYEVLGWISPDYRTAYEEHALEVIDVFKNDVLKYAWEVLKALQVTARAVPQNKGALTFLKRMGFSQVGTIRKDLMIKGELFDSVLFDCLNPDLEKAETVKTGESDTTVDEDDDPIEEFKGGRSSQRPDGQPEPHKLDVPRPRDAADRQIVTHKRVPNKPPVKSCGEHSGLIFNPTDLDKFLSPPGFDSKSGSDKRVFAGFIAPTESSDSE